MKVRNSLEHGLPCNIVFLDDLPDCVPPEKKYLHSSLHHLFGVKGEDNGNGEKKIGPRPKTRTAHHKGGYKK